MSEIDQGNSVVEKTQSIKDRTTIKECLQRPGVLEAVTKTVDTFRGWPGREMLLGITSAGMVFGLKWNNSGDPRDFNAFSYKAFALDTMNPADLLPDRTAIVDLTGMDVSEFPDGGTVSFDTRPKNIRNEHDQEVASFFDKTGGFNRPPPPETWSKEIEEEHQAGPPTVGGLPLYQLNELLPKEAK